MHVPGHFRETDREKLVQFMQQHDFATLISCDGKLPIATHLLVEVEQASDDSLYLNGHMSRANKQWRTFNDEDEILMIFTGPHTYISARWYNQVNVPTWNYMIVHAYGKPRLITDQAELYGLLKRLVDRYEANSGAQPPYQMETLPEAFVEKEMKGVVGFQIQVTRLEASFKLSQNRNQSDYDQIIAELQKRPDENSLEIARVMSEKRASRSGR